MENIIPLIPLEEQTDEKVIRYWKKHGRLHPDVHSMTPNAANELLEMIPTEMRELRYHLSGYAHA